MLDYWTSMDFLIQTALSILSNSMNTLWHSMKLHQYFREPLGGIPWNSTIFHGTPRKLHGISWHSMELYQYFMELHGTSWHSMELHGYSMGVPWNSMDFHWFSWNSMDFHGFPFNSRRELARIVYNKQLKNSLNFKAFFWRKKLLWENSFKARICFVNLPTGFPASSNRCRCTSMYPTI